MERRVTSSSSPRRRAVLVLLADATRRNPHRSSTPSRVGSPLTVFLAFSPNPPSDPSSFPQRKLNGSKLDLRGLYAAVTLRGGFAHARIRGPGKYNWTREIFPSLSNFTEAHRATSVGHDLQLHYQTYLLKYEESHPEDLGSNPPPALPRLSAPRASGSSESATAPSTAPSASPPSRGSSPPFASVSSSSSDVLRSLASNSQSFCGLCWFARVGQTERKHGAGEVHTATELGHLSNRGSVRLSRVT